MPKGNRYATLMRVRREDFGGEVSLAAPQLPKGVTMLNENVAPNLDVVPVVFEAAADAPVGGQARRSAGQGLDPNAGGLTGGVKQADRAGLQRQPARRISSPASTRWRSRWRKRRRSSSTSSSRRSRSCRAGRWG